MATYVGNSTNYTRNFSYKHHHHKSALDAVTKASHYIKGLKGKGVGVSPMAEAASQQASLSHASDAPSASDVESHRLKLSQSYTNEEVKNLFVDVTGAALPEKASAKEKEAPASQFYKVFM